jgi:transposase
MGWKGVTVMDQRVRFMGEYLEGYFPFNELCFQFSISRKTGYKWVERYEQGGAEGLTDRSRRPHCCPHATNDSLVEALVQAPERALLTSRTRFDRIGDSFGPSRAAEVYGARRWHVRSH